MKIEVFARCTQAGTYQLSLTYMSVDDNSIPLSQINMLQNKTYGDLYKATINMNDAGRNLEKPDITKEISIKVSNLNDKVEDMFLVVHYKLND